MPNFGFSAYENGLTLRGFVVSLIQKINHLLFNGRAASERNFSIGTPKHNERLENFVWLLNRMPVGIPPSLVYSGEVAINNDFSLVQRVVDAYRTATNEFQASAGGWDTALFNVKRKVHDALMGGSLDEAAAVLRDPSSSTFFWGFDAIASSPAGEPEPHELVLLRLNRNVNWQELYAFWLCDALVSFSEAIGGRRTSYPEIEIDATLDARNTDFNVDAVIDEIENTLGFELQFPNPFPNELGLPSKRGVIGFRSIQSAYQAWRISKIAGENRNFKIMEIGAGLGRTAYFANLFGLNNYTIVDIPLTNAAQGYFLGRVLGAKSVDLHNEPHYGGVRILPSTVMPQHDEKYDLIVNVDSWTEMSPEIAMMYWNWAKKSTNAVLSINHEFNPHTVRSMYVDDSHVVSLRYPYCMRRGYVEEFLTW